MYTYIDTKKKKNKKKKPKKATTTTIITEKKNKTATLNRNIFHFCKYFPFLFGFSWAICSCFSRFLFYRVVCLFFLASLQPLSFFFSVLFFLFLFVSFFFFCFSMKAEPAKSYIFRLHLLNQKVFTQLVLFGEILLLSLRARILSFNIMHDSIAKMF